MKLLHTGDWHLGKVLKGVPRLAEQRTVCAEIVEIVRRERVDLVVVAGDVFESAAPSADAQELAWSTLLALRATGAEVVVIGGNHDPVDVLEAVRPVFAAAGVHVAGHVRAPAQGGRLELDCGGARVRVALLPFVSARRIVRAAELFELDEAQRQGRYAQQLARLVNRLTDDFDGEAVNLVVAHATVTGARFGGGEREAQSIFDYHLAASVFPPSASYVALGHLHRTQSLPAPCPAWYAGAPIAVDFGEDDHVPAVVLVEAEPGRPARIRAEPLTSAVRLHTLTGTIDELGLVADGRFDAALVRVIVTEPARVGLADEVRRLLPSAIDIRVERPASPVRARSLSSARSPGALFEAYLVTQGIDDPRLSALFGELAAVAEDVDELAR